MSENSIFDIHAFDPSTLDIPHIISQLASPTDWTVTTVVDNDRRGVYRLDPHDGEQWPVLKLKYFRDEPALAQRVYNILEALHEFGVSIAARPFYAGADGLLICEWVHGESLSGPPSIDDEEMWHRIMAVIGVPKNLPFAKYASKIPMMGTGVQQPADLLRMLEDDLQALPQEHDDHQMLSELVTRARGSVQAEWHTIPKVAMARLDPDFSHFIWDGYHLRQIGFSRADWADVAYDVAQMAAHPDYEDLAPSHWVWFRWEYARLTHDEGVVARATTYTNLLYLHWAIQLTQTLIGGQDKASKTRLKQRDRYLQKVQRVLK